MRCAWMNTSTVLLSVFLLWCAGCGPSRDMAGKPVRSCPGLYLFECSYINYAWKFVLKGFFIDRGGNVYTFDHSNDKWMGPGGKRYSGEDLAEKYRNPVLVGQVDPETLIEKCALINEASKGNITRRHEAYDMGAKSYAAFIWFPDTDEYKPVALHSSGDWLEVNTSAAADSLVDWLKSVERRFLTQDAPE